MTPVKLTNAEFYWGWLDPANHPHEVVNTLHGVVWRNLKHPSRMLRPP
jgi:hypothetical protein